MKGDLVRYSFAPAPDLDKLAETADPATELVAIVEAKRSKGKGTQVPSSADSSPDTVRAFTLAEARNFVAPLLDDLRAAPDGTIRDTLNKAALVVGRFVGPFWSEADARRWLHDALAHTVADDATWKADAVITGAFADGRAQWLATLVPDTPHVDPRIGVLRPEDLEPQARATPTVPEPTASPRNGFSGRRLTLTPASAIRVQRVKWLMLGRMALASLSLLAGLEGLGKSTIGYWIAARVTRGELPGEHYGTPRGVLISASEDSWGHTIVPRLIAAGADLTRVFRVEVFIADIDVGLMLPIDLRDVEEAVGQVDAALLLLDPLMSRLDAAMDSHRYQDVLRALEPMAKLAERTGLSILGLIHHNKSGSSDPLQSVMGSKGFTSVARSVSTVIRDPNDDSRRLFGTPKNNLGPDTPTLAYSIVPYVIDTDEGPSATGRIEWHGEVEGTIQDAMAASFESSDDRTLVQEVMDWLQDFLAMGGGEALSADVKKAAHAAGHTDSTLHKARLRLKIRSESLKGVMPRRTLWRLPDA